MTIFVACVQKIDVDAAPSVLCQSLKSPLADIVALSDESLRSLINGSGSNSSSSTSDDDDSSLSWTPGISK